MRRRKLLLGLVCVVLLSAVVLLIAVQSLADGRINAEPYAGGTAIYCVDGGDTVSGVIDDGGIKVLSHSGRLLLFAPGSDLAPLVVQAKAGTLRQNALVASAPNAFGTGDLYLHVLTNGRYQLSGYDMHGSFFIFAWAGCDVIGSPPAESVPGPMATEEV